jgi:Flp pilus assembly pilin Flp
MVELASACKNRVNCEAWPHNLLYLEDKISELGQDLAEYALLLGLLTLVILVAIIIIGGQVSQSLAESTAVLDTYLPP